MKTGIANLPLHRGRAPRWLFEKMVELGREISLAVIEEYGRKEFLTRLADPYWFQSLGCVLGYDWHSSGVTTVTCGALKEALRGAEDYTGIFICGGKGRASRKTPQEIKTQALHAGLDPQPLIHASRISAKVDNNALQDGYQLYHHTFFFDREGTWTVIQQGLSEQTHYARRYHWFSERVKLFVEEPHAAICCDLRGTALDLTARESARTRNTAVKLIKNSAVLQRDLERLEHLDMPANFWLPRREQFNTKYLKRIFSYLETQEVKNFEDLLASKGVGSKTIRALSLIAELIYGERPSYRDPAKFSFALGGKDGVPFPIDRKLYEQTITTLKRGISRAKSDRSEKRRAFRRLYTSPSPPIGGSEGEATFLQKLKPSYNRPY